MSGQDRGLAAAENQGDRRLGRGQIRAAVGHHQSPAPFHPGQVPVACLLAPGSAGRQGRALAPLRRAPLPGQRGGLPGDPCSPTVSRSGPGSPLFNVWAVRLLSLSGLTPGYWPGSLSGPASCFAWQISSFLRGVEEAAQGRRSRMRGPKVGCRRRRYATSPRSPRHDRGGQCRRGRHAAVTAVAAGPGREPLCMNAPGRRPIGCVAFQPAAGTITSVASWLRGGDPDERPGQMEPRR